MSLEIERELLKNPDLAREIIDKVHESRKPGRSKVIQLTINGKVRYYTDLSNLNRTKQ